LLEKKSYGLGYFSWRLDRGWTGTGFEKKKAFGPPARPTKFRLGWA